MRPKHYSHLHSDSVFFDPITEETVEAVAIPDYVNYEYPTIYELETTPEMPPTDDGKSVNERLAVFEAKETLRNVEKSWKVTSKIRKF